MLIFAFVFVLLAGVPLFAGVDKELAKAKTKIRNYIIAAMVVSHCRWEISRFGLGTILLSCRWHRSECRWGGGCKVYRFGVLFLMSFVPDCLEETSETR